MKPSRVGAICATAVMVAALVPVRAAAAPDPQIVRVVNAAGCVGQGCSPSTDQPLGDGDVAGSLVRIEVEATSDLRPLEWVRLEAREGTDPRWVCLQHWTTGNTQSFSGEYEWETAHWPDPTVNSNCLENSPHYHGRQTQNQLFSLRVVARERRVPGEPIDDTEGDSPIFTVKLNNAPVAPTWVGDPRASSGTSPAVTVQWEPNDEPDLVEYVIVRGNPDGTETETPVNAKRPSRSDCTAVGDTAVKCVDTEFSGTYGGTYRYAIIARRRGTAGNVSCSNGKRCVESALSASKTVTVEGPTASGSTPTANPDPRPSQTFAAQPPDPGSRFQGQPVPPTPGPTPLPATQPLSEREPLPGGSVTGAVALLLGVGAAAWWTRRTMVARR